MTAVVAVLAGGRGRRMGAPKPLAELGGAPLIAHPLAAAAAAGLAAVVVAKPGTPLPDDLAVPVWLEPAEPVHPLLGVVTALERAGGPVVAVACDMPFVPAALLARLAAGPEAAVRVGRPARAVPGALRARRAARAARGARRAARRCATTLAALAPAVLDGAAFGDPARILASVNTPDELAAAELAAG